MIEIITQYKKLANKKVKLIQCYYTGGEYKKHIGTIVINTGKRLFYKRVNSQKHRLKLFNAYGIQEELFKKFLKGKEGKIRIEEDDTGTIYEASIKVWEDKGAVRDYGEEKQRFLSIDYMNFYKPIVITY